MISICRRRRRRRRRDERRNCPRMYTCERPQRDITVVCLHPRSELIGHCPDTSHINFKTLKKLNLTKQSRRRHCVFDHCRMLLLDVVFTKFCRVKMFLFWKYKSCKKSKSSWLFFCHMVSDFRKMQFIYNCLFTDRPGNKMVFFFRCKWTWNWNDWWKNAESDTLLFEQSCETRASFSCLSSTLLAPKKCVCK